MNWRDQATCHGAQAIFDNTHAEHLALILCRTCPVRDECLRDALTNGDTHLVRGGHTPAQLDALARQGGKGRRRGPAPDPLTDARVAALTRQGWTETEIAAEIGTSVRAVSRARARTRTDAPTTTAPTPTGGRRAVPQQQMRVTGRRIG